MAGRARPVTSRLVTKSKGIYNPLILRPIATRDGEVMVWDRIAEVLRVGGSLKDAAARCGVSTPSLHAWVRNGTRLAAAVETGGRLEKSLTRAEAAEVRVARTVETATAEGKLLLLGLLDRVSRGHETRVVTVKLDVHGNEIERTERTEQHGPDAATIRWRLSRHFPEEWAGRVEVTGAGGGPIEVATTAERASELAEALRTQLEAAAAGQAAATNGSSSNGNGAQVTG